MNLPRAILFDLDGTLVDTAPDLAAAMNHVLAAHGRPPLPVDDVRHLVGHGARALVTRGLNIDQVTDAPVVAAAGCALAICTNKPTHLAQALIEALGWQGRFAAIVGATSVPRPKPDAGHVFATLDAIAQPGSAAAFVGDSATDVGAARNAGLPVVLVSFGFTDTPAHHLGGDVVIDHYDALLPALRGLGPWTQLP